MFARNARCDWSVAAERQRWAGDSETACDCAAITARQRPVITVACRRLARIAMPTRQTVPPGLPGICPGAGRCAPGACRSGAMRWALAFACQHQAGRGVGGTDPGGTARLKPARWPRRPCRCSRKAVCASFSTQGSGNMPATSVSPCNPLATFALSPSLRHDISSRCPYCTYVPIGVTMPWRSGKMHSV